MTLEINTLGSPKDRAAYTEELKAFFRQNGSALSAESQARLERNPLRILDSKDEGDRKVLADAPEMSKSVVEGRDFFEQVKGGLSALSIPFAVNSKLVRGLDYYCHTVFEFTTTALGAQGTVLAGGRYDGLIQQMGGPPTPGIGWAAGVERLTALLAAELPTKRPIVVTSPGNASGGLAIAEQLRSLGHAVELDASGRIKNALERAQKIKARTSLILGEDERARGAVAARDLDAGTQEEVPLAALEERLARFR